MNTKPKKNLCTIILNYEVVWENDCSLAFLPPLQDAQGNPFYGHNSLVKKLIYLAIYTLLFSPMGPKATFIISHPPFIPHNSPVR